MKAVFKKHLNLVVMLLSIFGLIITNTFGVFKIFVLTESYTVFEFLSGFCIIFFFQLFGVAFIGYEGRGTPTNMLINGLFYFFMITVIISVVLYIKHQIGKSRSDVNKVEK